MAKQRYSGTKTNGEKSYRFTVVASSEKEAEKLALAQMRRAEGYWIELDDETKPVPTFTWAEDFTARTGLRSSEWELRDGKPE